MTGRLACDFFATSLSFNSCVDPNLPLQHGSELNREAKPEASIASNAYKAVLSCVSSEQELDGAINATCHFLALRQDFYQRNCHMRWRYLLMPLG